MPRRSGVGRLLFIVGLAWRAATLAVYGDGRGGPVSLDTVDAAAPQDDDDVDAASARAVMQLRHHGWRRPVFETHIHFYQVTRAGGVPWPPQEATLLYRDVLPAQYKAIALQNGIVAAGVVEASPWVEDNQWILDLIRGDDFFKFVVGSLEIGAPEFSAQFLVGPEGHHARRRAAQRAR
jgi:hypothetical protein